MNRILKTALPVLVVAVGALGAVAMIKSRKPPESTIPEAAVPLVRVQTVALEEVELTVKSQGTVRPRSESTLAPEIGGRLIHEDPSFVAGGFFEAGQVLLRIDAGDYEQALIGAQAQVAQAELRLAQEQARGGRWPARSGTSWGQGEPTTLTLRQPQVAQAEAAVAAARAAVVKAERDLERTRIRAPYSGRVREKLVGIGQFVVPGTRLATIYAVDFAEIRLPLPDSELAFVDLPLNYRGEQSSARGPEVVLRAEFAGRVHEWLGRIVRTEGEIDPRSRMVHAVARVADPYGRGDDPDRPPLAAGLFVEAEIRGRTVPQGRGDRALGGARRQTGC